MPPTYTTDGPVRGRCGHKHRSREAAERCLERDRRSCARLSSGLTRTYSDRRVVPVPSNDPR